MLHSLSKDCCFDVFMMHRYGEIESRWVAMESWTFSTTISAQEVAGLLEQQQVLLQLGGVDTYADVLINGEEVAYTTNFHRYVCVSARPHLHTHSGSGVLSTSSSGSQRQQPGERASMLWSLVVAGDGRAVESAAHIAG
jgi:hypothetical protein